MGKRCFRLLNISKTRDNSLLKSGSASKGFTIIELLVVIVVIGILTAVTIVSYTGITKRAHQASLESSLGQAVKALENYKITSASELYPASLAPTNVKFDDFITTEYNLSPNSTSYCLQGIVDGSVMSISNSVQSVVNKPCTENGLVGWWKLNGDATDSSGLGNNGTISGALATTGQNGIASNAMSFDGLDDYITISSPNNLSPSSITISGWLYLNNTGNWMMINRGGSSTPGAYYVFGYLNGSNEIIEFSMTDALGVRTSMATTIFINTWIHIVATFDSLANTKRLYINGVLMGTSIASVSRANITSPLYFGRYTSGYYTNGLIDDNRIYDRALSATEIQQLYSAGAQ